MKMWLIRLNESNQLEIKTNANQKGELSSNQLQLQTRLDYYPDEYAKLLQVTNLEYLEATTLKTENPVIVVRNSNSISLKIL
jgi:hypothetical protein